MAITFQTIPANNRVPGVYAEFQPQTSVGDVVQATLILGQITTAGTALPNTPILCPSAASASALCGPGSMLHRMVTKYFNTDTTGTVYILPLADDSSATSATATITFTSNATSSATVGFYVDGDVFQIGIAVGDTPASMVSKLTTQFAKSVNSFTYTSSNGVITLTAKNAGAIGNDMDLRLNYGGSLAGESLPLGVTITVTPFSGGNVNPQLATAFSNTNELEFDFITCPYADSGSLNAVQSFLSSRWAWNVKQFGQAFVGYRGTLGAATTLGLARNDQYTSIMPAYDSPTHPSLWTAAYTATAAVSIKSDPALPLNTATLDVLAPPLASRFDFAERSTLLFSGMSTFKVGPDGTVAIERAITTNQTINGVPSDSYLNVERLSTLTAVVRALLNDLGLTYARRVLVADGPGTVPAGSNRVTANLIKAHIVASYYAQQALGLVQNADTFAQQLVVENQGKGKVAVYWPADLAQQLEQIGVLVAFTSS